MFDAIIWGLVQGLTEFLPISSSGHLVLVPAFLAEMGVNIGQPELAITAVLHLGTLLAVVAYYRRDLLALARFEPGSSKVALMLGLGTLPALIGLPLKDSLDRFEDSPRAVAGALLVTAVILTIGTKLTAGRKRIEDGTWLDALIVGVFQALALVPGISRSGSTITAGIGRRMNTTESARFSFLLAVPAIAGGGILSLFDLDETGIGPGPMIAGLVISAISGYLAIAILLRVLVSVGFKPFAIYCSVVGILGLIVF